MQERKERKITLKQVFDEYPSCFFLVEPIIKDGKSEDFRYMYVTTAKRDIQLLRMDIQIVA